VRETNVSGVGLADGSVLPADLVVMAVGVRPNVELARAAGLPCDLGLLVDDTMLTNDPAIYAIGECVQHRGKTFGLVAPLLETGSSVRDIPRRARDSRLSRVRRHRCS